MLIAYNLRVMIRSSQKRRVSVLLEEVPPPELTLKPPAFYEDLANEFRIQVDRKSLKHIILGKSILKPDHFHPNAPGYRQFAEALSELSKKSGALHP